MFTFCPLQGALSESPASQSLLELDGGVKVLVDLGWDESFDVEKLKELEKYVDSEDSYELEEMYKVSGLERNNNSTVALTRLISFLKDGKKVDAKENVNYLQYFKVSNGRLVVSTFLIEGTLTLTIET